MEWSAANPYLKSSHTDMFIGLLSPRERSHTAHLEGSDDWEDWQVKGVVSEGRKLGGYLPPSLAHECTEDQPGRGPRVTGALQIGILARREFS